MNPRRSRIRRQKQGRHPQIGPRDVALFQILCRYRYLDSRRLWLLLPLNVRGRDETNFKKRLRQLWDWEYLERPKEQRRARRYASRHEVYELAPTGKHYL